jgi:type IV pilus assembly protein PilW
MNKQSGFSLVEIMIALIIGLFLLGGLLQLFSGAQQTYRMQRNLARLQENGRFALDFLAHDVRMTGYWGCMTSSSGDVSGAAGASAVPDTMILQGAFVLTPTGICGSPVNSANSCGAVNCFTDLTSTITYTISTPAVSSTMPNPTITLYRNTNNVPNPLIEGIENMKILYGVDSDGDGVANYYLPANPLWVAVDWIKVISIRISLLVATLDDHLTTQLMTYTYNGVTTTPTDYKIRRVFNTTIALRNRLL